MKNRSLSFKYGNILGLYDENIPLVQFNKSHKPDCIKLIILAREHIPNIYVKNLETNLKEKLNSNFYHIKRGESLYFGENVSILMTRRNNSDFKFGVHTKEDDKTLFVQKRNVLLVTGRKDSKHEYPFKLYEVSPTH